MKESGIKRVREIEALLGRHRLQATRLSNEDGKVLKIELHIKAAVGNMQVSVNMEDLGADIGAPATVLLEYAVKKKIAALEKKLEEI